MAISFTFNNFTVIDVTPQDPHVEVTMSFSIPIDPTTQRRYLLYKDDDHIQTTTTIIHRQAQSCQTLSDSELQVWELTITELLTVEIDPTTTALVSITITCITDDLIAFTAIFEEVCTTCGQTNTTQLAEDLTNDIETSLQTSVNNGTFIETLQDNANDTITNCQVNCEALEAELETINNITDFGEPTVDMETFIFVSSLNSISTTAYVDTSIIACKCSLSGPYDCNTDVLNPDDLLGICIKQAPSFSTDIELHDITSLAIDQANSNESLQIIQDHQPVNADLSEITDSGDVYFINTVVPARFFKSADSISVSGNVQVKFKSGTRRQLYVDSSVSDTVDSALHAILSGDTPRPSSIRRPENSILNQNDATSDGHPSRGPPQVFIDRSMEEDLEGMLNTFGFRVGLSKPNETQDIPHHKKIVSAVSSGTYMMEVGTTHIFGCLLLLWACFTRR